MCQHFVCYNFGYCVQMKRIIYIFMFSQKSLHSHNRRKSPSRVENNNPPFTLAMLPTIDKYPGI